MSYEYRLIFDHTASLEDVMDLLKSSDACVRAEKFEIYLKDLELKTLAEYDAKLTQDSDQSLWLEVNFKSINLYNLIQKILNNRSIRCFENGDLDDEATLKEAFRIKTD
jgi:hypothetical protein